MGRIKVVPRAIFPDGSTCYTVVTTLNVRKRQSSLKSASSTLAVSHACQSQFSPDLNTFASQKMWKVQS